MREDGREDEVFSLIGPKRYDAPWKDLENQGWIAPAICTEVRLSLDAGQRMAYTDPLYLGCASLRRRTAFPD